MLGVEVVTRFEPGDLHDICDAAESAIDAGGGFGWLRAPERNVLESYWKGVLVVPEHILIVARIDGTICGAAQLVRPPPNNEARAFAVQLEHAFIAPWARGHGLARMLMEKAEVLARNEGFDVIALDVRATQKRAIRLYETHGYVRWGRNPFYARVEGKPVAGLYYWKDLNAAPDATPDTTPDTTPGEGTGGPG
ncbi:MAG: GNAT family N-acetyltransferase [Rhodospirillaceae bacterium]|nr:GNAT family N-acetyltransferase [Rhodospirillaceae bacterium]